MQLDLIYFELPPSPQHGNQVEQLGEAEKLQTPALLFRSAKPSRCGVVFVHGKAGGFSGRHLTAPAQALAAAGVPALLFDNRGAGDVGNAREFFNDCVLDIDAACDVLIAETGCDRILLAGHSYGGLKAAWHLRNASRSERFAGLILMSTIPYLRVSDELVEIAQNMVQEGLEKMLFCRKEGECFQLYEPQALLLNRFQGFQGRTVDLLPMDLPIFSFASADEWEWFHEVTMHIAANFAGKEYVRSELLPDCGDHCYTDHESRVAETIVEWVLSVVLPACHRQQ